VGNLKGRWGRRGGAILSSLKGAQEAAQGAEALKARRIKTDINDDDNDDAAACGRGA